MTSSKKPGVPICYDPDIWFSPRNVLYNYSRMYGEVGESLNTKGAFKPIREAMSVAILLLGIMKLEAREYWLQIVPPHEQTPDIRTMYIESNPGKPNELLYQDVELVTLGDYTDESVDEFIKRTKLSGKKAYPESTVIVCHINKSTRVQPWRELHQSLASSPMRNNVFLLGRVDPNEQVYQIARVHPSLDTLVTVDVMAEASKPGLRGVMKMVLGAKPFTSYDANETHLPF